MSARRVTGVGDVAGGILANLRVEGAAQGHRQGADRRGARPHLRQAQGQAEPVRRPDHRPLRRRPLGRPDPLSHPRPRHRRRHQRAEGGARTRAAGAPWSPARAAPGCGASTTSSSPAWPAACPISRPTSSAATTSSSISATSASPRRRSGSPAPAIRRRDGTFFFEGKGAQATYGAVRDDPRRPDRAAEAGDPARPAERGAGPRRRAAQPRSDRRPASPIGRRGGRISARSPRTARSCCRRAGRP